MLKKFMTLARGHAHDTGEAITDKNATVILRQQIRECSQAIQISRKNVAIAMAQCEQEQKAYDRLIEKIEDLESRTLAALDKKQMSLAQEGAETIAQLEAERDVSKTTLDKFQGEVKRLRNFLKQSEQRLAALQRGQRLVQANNANMRLQSTSSQFPSSSLKDAEDTLKRLQVQQNEATRSEEILQSFEQEANPKTISEKLAAAGCGDAIKPKADDVLERLKAKQKK